MDNDTVVIGLKLLAILGLVMLNAFFVATEFALVSVRRSRIDTLVAEGNRRARSVLGAVKELDSYIAATQLGITIASIGLGWIGEPALATLLDPLFESLLPEPVAFFSAHAVAFAVAFSIVTGLHVIFGELAPKSIALQFPERTSLIVAAPTTLFLKTFRPIIFIMNGIGNLFLRSIGINAASEQTHDIYSEEELRLIVTSSRRGGELVESEEEIIRRAFVFHDLRAEEIMVPRTELIAISDSAPLDEIRDMISTYKYSRYPVWRGDRDEVIGLLFVRDLLPILTGAEEPEQFKVNDYVRPVLAVPTSIGVDQLLEEMKRNRTHVSVVVDEYGGTAGMATLEDILERVLGDVPDEFEQPEADISTGPDGLSRVDGLTLLADVDDYFGLDLDSTENNTIGGYVFSELGHRPEVGDAIEIPPYKIRVEEVDGLRIAELTFIPSSSVAAAESDGASGEQEE